MFCLMVGIGLLVFLVALALCAHAGHLDDRQIQWMPYHCTQMYCEAELPSLAAVDQHLKVHHGIGGDR